MAMRRTTISRVVNRDARRTIMDDSTLYQDGEVDLSRWDEIDALLPQNIHRSHWLGGGKISRSERDAMIYQMLCEMARLEAQCRE